MEFKYSDTRFDESLSKVGREMKWYPWVGDRYQSASPKLIVLGESHYNFGKDDAGRVDAERRLNNPFFNRELIAVDHGIDRGPNGNSTQRFYRNIESLLFQQSDPDVATTNAFWRRVAYFNLLQAPMRDQNTRPESPWDARVSGWEVALKICEIVKPTDVLVGGSNQCTFDALKHALRQSGHEILCEKKCRKVDRVFERYNQKLWTDPSATQAAFLTPSTNTMPSITSCIISLLFSRRQPFSAF